MQLQAAVHDLVQHFRRQRFHHRYFARARLAGLDQFRGMIGQRAGGRGPGGKRSKLEPHRLLIP